MLWPSQSKQVLIHFDSRKQFPVPVQLLLFPRTLGKRQKRKVSIVSIIRTSVDFGCHWLLQQKATDILLLVGAFSIGGLAGSLTTQKDPAGAILQVLKRRGLVFVLTSLVSCHRNK